MSYLTIFRNFGALLALCYMIGSLVTKNTSQNAQMKSVIKRSYQAKILTDKEMNNMLGMAVPGEEEVD